MAEEINRVLRDFLIESQEHLQQLEQNFVILEHAPDNEELLRSIFRTFHTIKGGAGFLNLSCLEQVAHQAENVLAKLRDHTLTLDEHLTTTLLHAVDKIEAILIQLDKTGQEGEQDIQDIVASLSDILAGNLPRKSAAFPTPAVSEESENQQTLEAESEKEIQVNEQGHEEEAITENDTISEIEDTRVHVDIGLLDHLMNLTGELVLARNRVVRLASIGTPDRQIFQLVAQQLNAVVGGIQENMIKTRMQPIKNVFGILPRLVRDISCTHGKKVELHIEGRDTELDRTILAGLKDPLMHLARNALDHGIELPELRRQQGKPATGKLTINAYHEGGQVHLDISDDGAGIDLDRIKTKAIRKGLMTSQQAEEASERQLLNLIFRHGFSTAQTVTNISGRGVGMEVVKRNLDKIGGVIDIETEHHHGTTFKIRIPITLAIIPVLIVTAGNQRFAIPQIHLEELVRLRNGDGKHSSIEEIYGAELYRLRGALLPLLRLSEVLQLPQQKRMEQQNSHIVVVSAGMFTYGIIVDGVGNTEEIVVKPLSIHIKQIPCYDGATILQDGKIALMLNINGLSASAQRGLKDTTKKKQPEGKQNEAPVAASHEEHRQTIVLVKIGHGEYCGVPLAFVQRLEDFPSSQIARSGGREVLPYRGDVLPLIRLESCLNLEPVPDPEMVSLIIFSVEQPIGLVVHELVNTMEISTQINTKTFQQKGVLGSTIVNGQPVLILDIHGLIELTYPSWYQDLLDSKLTQSEREQTRILLVEDSTFFLNIEISYLESVGYQVISAEHGLKAVEKLEEEPVDVVITDIDMPYCNGYELTKIIRARTEWKHLPIMALTALSEEENRRKGIEAGIDEYKIKLDREEVLRSLEHLILRTRKKTKI